MTVSTVAYLQKVARLKITFRIFFTLAHSCGKARASACILESIELQNGTKTSLKLGYYWAAFYCNPVLKVAVGYIDFRFSWVKQGLKEASKRVTNKFDLKLTCGFML